MLVDHIDDALAEITYDASLAGLHYSTSNDVDGIYVGVAGYSDKLDVLLRIVLEKLRDLVVLPDRLRVLKEKVGQVLTDRRLLPSSHRLSLST